MTLRSFLLAGAALTAVSLPALAQVALRSQIAF
jgi:hypothetical protein